MSEPIAVIGLACTFPGAADVTGFWDNIVAGVDVAVVVVLAQPGVVERSRRRRQRQQLVGIDGLDRSGHDAEPSRLEPQGVAVDEAAPVGGEGERLGSTPAVTSDRDLAVSGRQF